GVSHFRLPPDYRESWKFGAAGGKNLELRVPSHRFPQWHFCNSDKCQRLEWKPLGFQNPQPKCRHCEYGRIKQVPFLAICEAGHLADFPFSEWVHKTLNPPDSAVHIPHIPQGQGGGLASLLVMCAWGAQRPLGQILQGDSNGTFLSKYLTADNSVFLCEGWMPWHGSAPHSDAVQQTKPWVPDGGCGKMLQGALRTSTNTYFAEVRSAIFLPRKADEVPAELITALEVPHVSVYITALVDAGTPPGPELIRPRAGPALEAFTDDQIDKALAIIIGVTSPDQPAQQAVPDDTTDTAFRRTEFTVLQAEQDEAELRVGSFPLAEYGDWVAQHFSRVMVVEKLRETRAHLGFQRLKTGAVDDYGSLKAMLRREQVKNPHDDWLPAYVVYGEGIFFELNEERLSEWESRPTVRARIDAFQARYTGRLPLGIDPGQSIPPRFLLLHTLAHIVMNQLTFDAGYSTAAIRERLYVSTAAGAPMGGMLIYTAAGDAEGTMGGLVRMGRPNRLGPSIQRAIEDAGWCSADPVCMEYAEEGGQGPEGCNLAACHGCALVPETACEHFNRFLDRGLVVGSFDSPELAFFTLP
ncbi:MAG: DUF1998 domain-containing protein, partial [Gemmatimonadota bacterium]|nr:DUF1998 domain-containing protein [Gemmatimonadota bacterium]